MKILLACMKHAYGDSTREYSYEYFNFYLSLKEMGHDVELFDYMGEIQSLGKTRMNQRLLARAKEWQPIVTLFSLYTDQFDVEVVKQLREHTRTLCFFHDDTWRVDYSRFWARNFDFFTTPDIYGELKYSQIGLHNAIFFPFGSNEKIFRKLETPKKYDISFVGSWHPYRQWVIEKLRKEGFDIEVFGYRWPRGEVDQEKMVRIFNESRINLNLSNSASWDVRYLASSPRAFINRLRSKKNVEQLKARIFEVSGCGSFQLSYYVEGLACCYDIDREISVYADVDDLIEKTRFFLTNDELRESIATAAYKRTNEEHIFAQRFKKVFKRMGVLN